MLGLIFVAIFGILAIVILAVVVLAQGDRAELDKPQYRGTYYSQEHGCLFNDMRSDNEIFADANKNRK